MRWYEYLFKEFASRRCFGRWLRFVLKCMRRLRISRGRCEISMRISRINQTDVFEDALEDCD